MWVAEDPQLACLLTPAQAAALAGRLGVSVNQADLDTLHAVLRAYLGSLPFQNVTMLARDRRPPTAAEMVADVLSGRGGPCGVMNPLLGALLHRLGYEVCLLSGTMQQPDCHIALLVRVAGRAYWLDAGNGHPYLSPIPLGDEAPRRGPGLSYRLRTAGAETYAVEHHIGPAGPWQTSYTFRTVPRTFRFFAGMIERHYTRPGFGPFLTGLRIIRCPGGTLHALRDRTLLVGAGEVDRRELLDPGAFFAALRQYFGDLDLPIAGALAALEAAGVPLFPGPAGPG